MVTATDVEHPSAGVSKAVFGNSYMLGLMRTIAQQEQDTFTTTELLTSLDIAVNLIHPLLGRLERAQMIERAGRVPGERTLLFRRLPSPLWQAALLLDGETI